MSDEYVHTPVTVEGKTAVVIGGTSGIGRGIARGFAADGADVVATSRTASKVEDAAAELRSLGAETVEVTCDVTDRASLDALIDATEEKFDGVDVLVNSGGAVAREGVLAVSDEDWHDVLAVQLDGVYRAIQQFGRRMDDGSIINIASLSAIMAIPNLAAYSAAKGGLDALTRAAAKELAPAIRVNGVRPGFIMTPQTGDAYGPGSHRRKRVEERSHLGRMGTPEEIAGAAIYLASDAAGYTTGEIITVDGGFTPSAF
mgnify:CR=1 FL=1